MDVSENSGTPKSSISIGFFIINHPFWGSPIFRNTHIYSPKTPQQLDEETSRLPESLKRVQESGTRDAPSNSWRNQQIRQVCKCPVECTQISSNRKYAGFFFGDSRIYFCVFFWQETILPHTIHVMVYLPT